MPKIDARILWWIAIVLVSPLTFAGVGKTVIAAFDYKRFKKANPRARLLFVAHRKEILEQSIQTFQEILNDFNFGETNAKVTFIYDNEEYLVDIFPDQGEVVYQFGSRWFHGADDFLEKARVNQKRLTTVYHQIRDIKVRK